MIDSAATHSSPSPGPKPGEPITEFAARDSEPGQELRAPADAVRRRDPWSTVWNALTSPWLLFGCTGVTFLAVATALVVPQLPSQIDSEAGAATRWIANASGAYGALGEFMARVGLFSLLQNPVFRVVLAITGTVILVQIVATALAAYRLRRLTALLDLAPTMNGEPLPIAMSYPVRRWRAVYEEEPLATANDIRTLLPVLFDRLERRTVRVTQAPAVVAFENTQHPRPPTPPSDPLKLEERLLNLRAVGSAALRTALPLGMLVALLLIWWQTYWGWEFRPDPLIPGGRATMLERGISLAYTLEQLAPGMMAPALRVEMNEQTTAIPFAGALQATIDGANVDAEPGPPGLVVQTSDGSALLARPGQTTTSPQIGLGFPADGERRDAAPPPPGHRAAHCAHGSGDVRFGRTLLLPGRGLPGRQRDAGAQIHRRWEPRRGRQRRCAGRQGTCCLRLFRWRPWRRACSHVPAPWLFWLALALTLVGLFGYRRRPGFALVQVGPWPDHRAVVNVQTDDAQALTVLQTRFEAEQGGRAGGRAHPGAESEHDGARQAARSRNWPGAPMSSAWPAGRAAARRRSAGASGKRSGRIGSPISSMTTITRIRASSRLKNARRPTTTTPTAWRPRCSSATCVSCAPGGPSTFPCTISRSTAAAPHSQRINPAKVILVEGILIYNEKELRDLMDMRIFVDTDADIRFIRRLRRDIAERGRSLDSVVKQYLGTVRPMHMEFVEPSKRYADIIVPQGGDNRVAMAMIVSRVQQILHERRVGHALRLSTTSGRRCTSRPAWPVMPNDSPFTCRRRPAPISTCGCFTTLTAAIPCPPPCASCRW